MTARPFARRCRAAATIALGLALMALLAAPDALAAGAATAISIAVPGNARLGQTVTLQARMIDSTGALVANAQIEFVSPATFLGTSGDVVIAEATTDKAGLATAQWQVRRTGTLTVRAEYRGDSRYAPSQASAQIAVTGSQQLYVQQAGVQIPGLNTAPTPAMAGLWPRLSGWPIALALLIVWSLYGATVFLIFRIAFAAHPGDVR